MGARAARPHAVSPRTPPLPRPLHPPLQRLIRPPKIPAPMPVASDRFPTPAVAQAFAAFPPDVRPRLRALRALVYATARRTPGVGPLEETLKWGQPSFLTTESKSGSTIRLDAVRAVPGRYALYVHCQTTLVATFREKFGRTFRYEGNRALLFDAATPLPEPELAACIALALTYHLQKRPARVPIGQLIR